MHSQLTFVHAARNIRRGDHTVVKSGSPGRVLDAHPSWFETTYTVKFAGIGKNHRGAITLVGLNNDDVQPSRTQKRVTFGVDRDTEPSTRRPRPTGHGSSDAGRNEAG